MKREYLYDRPAVPGSAGSVWLSDRERPPRPPVTGDVSADVAVIGAGLTGVLTAVRLAEDGARVVLVEGRRVCGDVSGHTSAKATAQHGLVHRTVPQHATVPWLQANVAALDRLEELAALAAPSSVVRTPSYLYTTDSSAIDELRREAALYEDAGLVGGMVDDGLLPAGLEGAVRLERQALINPVALCDGLLDWNPGALSVYEGSIVRSVDEERQGAELRFDGGRVHADRVVCASHHPLFDTLLYSTRLFQYRTYAFEIRVQQPAPEGMWFTEDLPRVAWRPLTLDEPMRLVVSGVDHKAGQGGDERECYARLEAACRERFGPLTVLRHWSTQDNFTPDGLPIVGRMIGRDRFWVASGYNGWGMTTSAVAADVLTAQLAGEKHELGEMLSPSRIAAKGFTSFARENVDFAWEGLTGETTGTGEPDDVAAGEGRTMRTSGGHAAVTRDLDGTPHVLDAHCTHLRCEVRFNEAEGTWDCPCHGSRFLGDGGWLHGPARRALEQLDGD